jgi:PAS domain S-box-containing protein
MEKHENTDTSGRYAAIADALHKYLEIFSTNKEETFEKVMTNGIRPFADAVGLDRVVFYKMVNTEDGKRLGQIYRWDKAEGGLIPVVEELKVLPKHPVLDKWFSITSQGGCVRLKESDYSEDEAAFLRTYGVKSILILPIFTHGKFWGNISYQDHTNGVYFDEGCMDLLYAAARISSNSIIRDEMKRRLNMEDAVNRAAVIFLSQNEITFEATMTAGVREIANAFNLDRFSIWRNLSMHDGLHGGQIYRWDRESGGTTVATKGLEDIVYAKLAPRWEKLFASGEIINSPARLLPEAETLKSFGCVTVFITPIFINNIIWGFALIEDRSNERFFEDDDVDMLRSAAFLCANTVIRADMEREIGDTYEFNTAILDVSPLGFTIFDENGNVIDCNDTLVKLLKTTKKYYVEHFYEFSPEYQSDGSKSIDKAIELVKRVLNGEKLVFEWILCTSEKEPIHNEVTLVRAMYKGKYVALGYQYNLQEIKNREMELAHAKELIELQLAKLNTVVHATKIGLWDMEVVMNDPLNPSNPIICSDEFRHMLGYKDENDFPSRLSSWTSLLHPQDMEATLDIFKKHILDKTGKTPYDVEYRMQRKTGEYGYYRATGESIRDKDGNAIRIVGALTDITETKNMLIQKDMQMEAVEAANRAKSTFLSHMSHEIRSPLNAVIGMINIGYEKEDIEEVKVYLLRAKNAANHVLNVINDILDMSKIEANKLELSFNDFDFKKMISKIVDVTGIRAQEKHQQITVNMDPNIPSFIKCDELRLTQVITNLMTNSIKFTPENGKITLSASKTDEKDGEITIRVEVTDNGIGISSEQQTKLFKAYTQADGGTTRKFGGTGLGLAISKSIIELMQGTIWIESELDKGAKFIFTIKVKKVEQSADKSSSADPAGIKADDLHLSGYTILAAEDTDFNREILAKYLDKTGVAIDFAENGKIAVDMFKKNSDKYSLIFMDINMPEMSGDEATKEIRALDSKKAKEIPIIAMTADVFKEDIEKCLSVGMNDHISKPLVLPILFAKLKQYMGV